MRRPLAHRLASVSIAVTLVAALSAQSRPATSPAPVESQPADPRPAAEALDRTLGDLQLESQTLAAVLETLSKRAGVRFDIDDDTYATLPWGRDTRLATLKLSGASLRAALDEILKPLGFVYSIGENSVRIVPSDALARINRRATWDDLHYLQMLNSTPCTQQNLAKIKFQYRITTKTNAPQLLGNQFKRAGDGTIAQILDVATRALGWTWFPDQDHVVILSAQAHIAHNLARTVTARYNQMGLAHILLDLADKADVPIFLEPGLMLKLPPNTANNYTLLLQQTTVRDALELICAETGLAYQILRDGISISLAPDAKGNAAGARNRGDPYVARIVVPAKNGNYNYEFLIRESELPQDVREYRGQMIDEMIEKVRLDMSPAANPESAPATPPGATNSP